MSNFKTKDCVVELNKIKKATWKRTLKYKGDCGYIREFVCKQYPNLVGICMQNPFVVSKLDVYVVEFVTDIDILNQLVTQINYYGGIYFSEDGFYYKDNKYSLTPITAPLVNCPEGGVDFEYEQLDFENVCSARVENGKLYIEHGGDWQYPQEAVYRLTTTGLLFYDKEHTHINHDIHTTEEEDEKLYDIATPHILTIRRGQIEGCCHGIIKTANEIEDPKILDALQMEIAKLLQKYITEE
jgi:hypothetical protein